MNHKDTNFAIDQLRAYIIVDKDKNKGVSSPVIAFDINEIVDGLKNSPRKIDKVVEHLNEILCGLQVCQKLGGIYTLVMYEFSTAFLIKADKVVSYTDTFKPEEKVIEGPSYVKG